MSGIDVSRFIDDRTADGVFRVDRGIYFDPEIFESEMETIFERGWVYLCHGSQIPKPGDYYATHIGRQPVYAHRQPDGSVRAFLNACAHRGAILTPFKQGNARVLTCRFHGWSYAADGRCLKIKNEDGAFPDGFDRGQFNLKAVPRVAVYRDFVFGCLDPAAGDLDDHLGDARAFIDLFVDQSPDGIEVLPGSQSYICRHNWKLQAENVTDGYHVSTVHRNFMTTVIAREDRDATDGLLRTEVGRIQGKGDNGCYDLGNGHIVLWTDRASPEVAPLYPEKQRIERDFPAGKAKWMLDRGRNVLFFPNMVLNDLASTHLRTHRPLTPETTEVTIWCIAPVGETRDARNARLRKFEDFFLVTGMSTSDDIVCLDVAQEGMRARAARWSDFSRGVTRMHPGADDPARELGIDPAMTGASWDHESTHACWYRHWARLLAGGATRAVAAE